MTTITIVLPDERLLELKERAVQYSVSPEELVLISIEDLLSRPDESFQQAVDYVIRRNAALYRRLA
jgi:antitoxin FitA